MLAKRIIPCLDIYNGSVVKGKQFINHEVIGNIMSLVKYYINEGADELVFYDISASANNKKIDKNWIANIANIINVPFCVAGGIKSIKDAKEIINLGADKISINSPGLNDPLLISKLSKYFGVQCIVIGIDTWYDKKNDIYLVNKYTGNIKYKKQTKWNLFDWIKYVQELGAGEIVLNMMNKDGLLKGYDINLLSKIRPFCKVPLIASGGIGSYQDFLSAFNYANIDGALAASVFHKNKIKINHLKKKLYNEGINIRI